MNTGIMPDYCIKAYSFDYKKVVRMKSGACLRVNWDDVPCSHSESKKVGDKFYSSFARAKSNFFDIVMSNDWDYFVTLTLDPEKYNRFDLPGWRRALNQWFRHLRSDRGWDISYAFVPERHKDGAWHIHGLIRCPQLWDELQPFEKGKHPKKLVDGTESQLWRWWPEYQERFGFCSLSPIRNHEACCRYVCKYITKDMARVNAGLNAQLYTASVGLKRPVKHHIYGVVPELNKCCTYDTAYAKIGNLYVTDEQLLAWCDVGANEVYINNERVGGYMSWWIDISDEELPDLFPWCS